MPNIDEKTRLSSISMKFSSRSNSLLNGQSFCLPKGTTVPNVCEVSSCSGTCQPPTVESSDSDNDFKIDEESSESSSVEILNSLGDSSSVEDIEDAFREETERKDSNKKIKIDSKKEIRQWWDADSLKQHALGKF